MMILAVFALGAALGTNALLAKLLTPSPAKLAAARGSGVPVLASTGASEGAPETPQPVAGSRVATVGDKQLRHYLDPIKKRNIFDSEANKATPKAVAVADDGEVTKKSELDAKLISTMEAVDPKWSTALITAGGRGPFVYMIGEQLLTAKIYDIKRPDGENCARVIVENGGELEYIDACEASSNGRKTAGVAPTSADTTKGGRHTYSIKDLGDGKFEIPPGDLEYAMSNLDQLGREARVVPNFADGQPNGWKVFSIRRTSALRQMGIKNNDVLTAVNGHDLSNTEKALEVYSKLQSEKSFSVEVLRNGTPMTLEYEVR